MPTRYDSDDDLNDNERGDREISLGTGTVLAIFLALALVCSLFFGLGYSMGRKSAPSAALATSPTSRASIDEGRPATGNAARSGEDLPSTKSPSDSQVAQPESPARDAAKPSAGSEDRHTSHERPQPSRSAAEIPAPEPPSPAAAGPLVQTYVQVAAVSRREDADLLLTAMKRRGYAGIIRPQTQDKLLHIQVGPFPTKKEAEAMRQRLIVDGYNPILK